MGGDNHRQVPLPLGYLLPYLTRYGVGAELAAVGSHGNFLVNDVADAKKELLLISACLALGNAPGAWHGAHAPPGQSLALLVVFPFGSYSLFLDSVEYIAVHQLAPFIGRGAIYVVGECLGIVKRGQFANVVSALGYSIVVLDGHSAKLVDEPCLDFLHKSIIFCIKFSYHIAHLGVSLVSQISFGMKITILDTIIL